MAYTESGPVGDFRVEVAQIKRLCNSQGFFNLGASFNKDAMSREGLFVGRRRLHRPAEVWLLWSAMITIFGSATKTQEWLHYSVWEEIALPAFKEHFPKEMWLWMDKSCPTRAQWIRAAKWMRPYSAQLREVLRHDSLDLALRMGYFADSNRPSWANPSRNALVVGDGKVFDPISKKKPSDTIVGKDGKVQPARVDTGSSFFGEGGKDHSVFGPKIVALSARDDRKHSRIVLDLEHMGRNHDEAAFAVDMALRLFAAAPGCLGVVWDGALRSVDHERITGEGGRLSINRTHAKFAGDGIEERIPKGRYILSRRPRGGQRCAHHFWGIDGALYEDIGGITGTEHVDALQPVKTRLERRQLKRGFRWYLRATVPCALNGEHEFFVSINQTDKDRGRKPPLLRQEYLRQFGMKSPQFEKIIPWRQDAESLNSTLDRLWHAQRMPAWGKEQQELILIGLWLTHNVEAAARFGLTFGKGAVIETEMVALAA